MILATLFPGSRAPVAGNFRCEVCGKSYKYRSTLKRHVQNECNVEPKFQCALCPFKTKQHSSFKFHAISKHSDVLHN
ncbi:hypothetical protein J6590_014872 [Homalodisca vitripennis]|nr:hypothetical protein J6590_014872 [Homalodisca vitripennis]